MKINYSCMAQVRLEDFDLNSDENQSMDLWMNSMATHRSNDEKSGAYEFIVLVEHPSFDSNLKKHNVPDRVISAITEARNQQASFICFF